MSDDVPAPRRKFQRWILLTVSVLLALAVLALNGLFIHLHHSLPKVQGGAEAPGLGAPADIVRDAHGIPHIYAASAHDAFFAQGYAHAQDRLWQMDFTRRTGAGRLAAILGGRALGIDRFMRALDIKGVAQRDFAALPERTRAVLDAYAAGVNAYLQTRHGPLPPEFVLLGIAPEPWRPQDSILVAKLLALQLAGNMAGEATRAALLKTQSPQMLRKLFPGLPGPLPKLAELYPEGAAGHAALDIPLEGASNNWVVSGARSASGKPLLANDPHLGLTLPCVWYLAHLAWDGRNVIGASLPGVPGIILGRNDDIAWGYTNSDADVQDLVVERIDAQHKDRYAAPEGSKPFTRRTETIEVKGGAPVRETFLGTDEGPVIPADLPLSKELVPEGHALVLRWTALQGGDRTLAAGFDILTAASGAAFVEAMRNWRGPTQNMLYADKAGTIGFIIPGEIPLRARENGTLGLVPAPGWEPSSRWQGAIPFDALPQTVNPPDGVIVTANNRVVAPDYPYVLGYEWDRDARARRIRALIDATPRHDVASFAAILKDSVSLEARALMPLLLTNLAMHPPRHALATQARIRLSQWDGAMTATRAEPLIFAAWLREIERGLLEDKLKDQYPMAAGWRFDLIESVLSDDPSQAALCDDTRTPAREDCSAVIADAFDRALAALQAQYGARMAQWRWGTAHKALFAHRPLDGVPVIGALLRRTVASDGGADTVNRGQTDFSGPAPFANVHGATYRAVYDLGDPENSAFMIASGQSGNPFSRHYDDLIPLWAKGEMLPMRTARAAIEGKDSETLRLSPPQR